MDGFVSKLVEDKVTGHIECGCKLERTEQGLAREMNYFKDRCLRWSDFKVRLRKLWKRIVTARIAIVWEKA